MISPGFCIGGARYPLHIVAQLCWGPSHNTSGRNINGFGQPIKKRRELFLGHARPSPGSSIRVAASLSPQVGAGLLVHLLFRGLETLRRHRSDAAAPSLCRGICRPLRPPDPCTTAVHTETFSFFSPQLTSIEYSLLHPRSALGHAPP